ncbi:hypothetical protein MKZ38_000738 [Zalerion maritima]|uniref:Uncharacterized protein n=1 Tax=Zalerion maritima TaxID=339359 RepID=A0AAD5WLV0_9PEZI|nr:hypothetical protein MKZ38_000738 [Zalerion maritima]
MIDYRQKAVAGRGSENTDECHLPAFQLHLNSAFAYRDSPIPSALPPLSTAWWQQGGRQPPHPFISHASKPPPGGNDIQPGRKAWDKLSGKINQSRALQTAHQKGTRAAHKFGHRRRRELPGGSRDGE